MKLFRQEHECMASDIMLRRGYVCLNPDVNPFTSQIWEKNGVQYKFTGWEDTPKTGLMAANPKYINIEEIKCTM